MLQILAGLRRICWSPIRPNRAYIQHRWVWVRSLCRTASIVEERALLHIHAAVASCSPTIPAAWVLLATPVLKVAPPMLT